MRNDEDRLVYRPTYTADRVFVVLAVAVAALAALSLILILFL